MDLGFVVNCSLDTFEGSDAPVLTPVDDIVTILYTSLIASLTREIGLLTYVHETASHRPNDRNVTRLLQRQDVFVVLKQNDRLFIQVSCKFHSFGAVDQRTPLVLRCSGVRVLKETHFKLGPKQPSDSSVNDRNIELAGLDKLGDLLKVAVRQLVSIAVSFDFNGAYNEPPPISTSVPAFSSCVVTASMSIGSLSQSLKYAHTLSLPPASVMTKYSYPHSSLRISVRVW